MSIICKDKIPAHRFNQFHEILIFCGGRYVHNPQHIGQSVFVEYKFCEDIGLGYAEFCKRWNRMQLHIVEKQPGGFFNRVWKMIKGRL